jgi:flavin-dependent dehydrogenase
VAERDVTNRDMANRDVTRLDVAIVGGGMAGNLLARQLSRRLPGRRIALFEKRSQYSHSVGESLVEIASNYLIRRLGLSSYLYDRHFPKNGLRFFFDSEDRDTALQEMSEIGSDSLPFHPAFQIDRSRFEADLIDLNGRSGIEIHSGVRVEELELTRGETPHRFQATDDHGSRSFESRWLIDASGRSRMVARQQQLDVPETELANGAIWGWFEGVTDVDDLDPPEWRERIRQTPRRLSTMHFLYRGYWIWFIPLKQGMTSVGVVYDTELCDLKYRGKESFLKFLHEHEAVSMLLADAKLTDARAYPRLAYGTKRFFSSDRWALVGEAGAFPDPFYSPGGDFIALANDFTTDLIARDLEGAEEVTLRRRTDLYDDFMQFRFEAAMRLYRGHYPFFGSFELCKLKWDFDIGCYYNLWLSAYMNDEHLDARKLKRQLGERFHVLSGLSNFTRLFEKVDAALIARGDYRSRNRLEFTRGLDCLGFLHEIGQPRTDEQVLATTHEIFNEVRGRALDLLEGHAEPTAREPKPMDWFVGDRDLSLLD